MDHRSSTKFLPLVTVALILLVAAGLRSWSLPRPPAGPYYDEAANGILAGSIARGEYRPLFITAYTGKEVLFFYWTATCMKLTGTINLSTLRLSSAIAGLLTVIATVWLVYELFKVCRASNHGSDNPQPATWLALLTAALLATSFWHLTLSRVGLRAITQPLLQALSLAAFWRGLRADPKSAGSKRTSMLWIALGGFFCGLAGYTYLAARLFPLPLGLALSALLLLDRGQRRRRLVQVALFILVAGLVFAPLGRYFLTHPDQFFTRIEQVGQGQEASLSRTQAFLRALEMFFLRGDPSPRYNLVERPIFSPLVGGLFVVGLLLGLYRLIRPAPHATNVPLDRTREILLLAWIPSMILPTALTTADEVPSNLRAAGLLPLVYLFPARGLYALLKWPISLIDAETRVRSSLASTIVCLLALALTLPPTARAYFGDLAHSPAHYDLSEGDLVAVAEALNRADLSETTPYIASLHYRHPTVAFLTQAYAQVKWLAEGQTLVYPASGQALILFPRSVLHDLKWLEDKLPPEALVEVGQGPGEAPAYLAYRFQGSAPDPSIPWPANLSNTVELLGYDLLSPPQAGEPIDLLITWRVLALPAQADTLPFLRLVDPWGNWWGQLSHFRYPSEQWTPGEVVIDHYRLPVNPGAPPGDYQIKLGFYAASTDSNLPLLDGGGSYAGTAASLPVRLAQASQPPDPAELDIGQRVDLALADSLTLLGYNLPTPEPRPGERVRLTLYWRAEASPTSAWAVRLTAGDQTLYEGAPVHGTYPTDRWTAGEIVVDHYSPRLPPSTPPGEYPLRLTLLGSDAPPLELGRLSVPASQRSFEIPEMEHSQQATFGQQIELLGYDLDTSQAKPGGVVRLTLYWRALIEIEVDYTVFTHLLGVDGQIVAQKDNPPVNGSLPTTLWLAGQVVADPYVIELPLDLPPGDYPFQVGFYLVEGGTRLGEAAVLDSIVEVTP